MEIKFKLDQIKHSIKHGHKDSDWSASKKKKTTKITTTTKTSTQEYSVAQLYIWSIKPTERTTLEDLPLQEKCHWQGPFITTS